MEDNAPLVFLSHASEDKDRFVLSFATGLRDQGVDAWLDRWEMSAGDSLVDKIFEEGIGRANAVVVVVSKYSSEKPWVREELNAAFVKRINQGSLLIPVILDGVKPPVSLQSTLYVRVQNPSDPSGAVSEVVSSVFRHTEKPTLGAPPPYVRRPLSAFPNLDRVDELVLSLFAQLAVDHSAPHAKTEDVWKMADRQGVSRDSFLESLEMLEGGYSLKSPNIAAEVQPFFSLPWQVLYEFLEATDPTFSEYVLATAAAAANEGGATNESIAESLDVKPFKVNVVLKKLEGGGYIELFEPAGHTVIVGRVLPRLKRAVRLGEIP